MKKNLIKPINSSFLSCEKDVAIILDKLFKIYFVDFSKMNII